MTKAVFKHYDLRLVSPRFESKLTSLAMDLNHLREKRLSGTTNPEVFFELKGIFHALESIASARIEGNQTTIAEYMEIKSDPTIKKTERVKEIANIEKTINFIEDAIINQNINIDRAFICEIHKMVVDGLTPSPQGEGDRTPGEYRTDEVEIGSSSHRPPIALDVPRYMIELFDFINKEDAPQYDLIKTAITHHRFAWIHPFRNGNGRTVRLLTYAMLVKQGFNVNVGRILNPTAVFSIDRDNYNKQLSLADEGNDESIEKWCEYVLYGLKEEIEKIDRLLDHEYLSKNILIPTIKHAIERQYITEEEGRILIRAANVWTIKTGDIRDLYPMKNDSQLSIIIRNLRDRNMLTTVKGKSRYYRIKLDNNFLIRSLMTILGNAGFLPTKD